MGVLKGRYVKAGRNLEKAHVAAYRNIHNIAKRDSWTADVGYAQHVPYFQGEDIIGKLIAPALKKRFVLQFINRTLNETDFIGVNYYGMERLSKKGIFFDSKLEVSEAGRTVSPNGLFKVLDEVNALQKNRKRDRPIWITENGVSDATDLLRPAYMTEHLAAVHQATEKHIPVKAYFFWTLTDNLEWADGYCPKFGLLSVDREDSNLARSKRDTFVLYQKIIQDRGFTSATSESNWGRYIRAKLTGKLGPLCRGADPAKGLHKPRFTAWIGNDWRFGL